MLKIDMQELLKNGESRYALVIATAKRARMIVDKNAKAAKEEKSSNAKHVAYEKPVSIAVTEYVNNKWTIVNKKNNDETSKS